MFMSCKMIYFQNFQIVEENWKYQEQEFENYLTTLFIKISEYFHFESMYVSNKGLFKTLVSKLLSKYISWWNLCPYPYEKNIFFYILYFKYIFFRNIIFISRNLSFSRNLNENFSNFDKILKEKWLYFLIINIYTKLNLIIIKCRIKHSKLIRRSTFFSYKWCFKNLR